MKCDLCYCADIDYNIQTDTSDNFSNETIINIIPKQIPHIQYNQKPKMNFEQLLYNFGGITGIWFGWSAVTTNYIMLSIFKIFVILVNQFYTYYYICKTNI